MSVVSYSRFLDSAIMGIFTICLSGLTLYLFGEFWGLCQSPPLSKWSIGKIMSTLFPFKRTFDVNLTHILLFSIIICLLSLRSDQGTNSSKCGQKQKRND
ncbi:apicomplexan small protein [Cryptosporidium parvum]|uniref:Apicomplexan small protein n=4 Tax=Cryptosporidium TaxID=5806 RepID=A0A0S4TBS4_CRYHO|nr:hypothetical protein [Cryptosporidium hominis TU502]OLQ19108.1 hypothetical protein ChTU502y2012_418g0235 [Cryptosporidium hominis]POM85246.1 hypothetical protein CmeUKMEL1_16460 [Cryptosporidium meleagridis]QOY43064.1 Uncharacterized protein CPATCC_0029130 [Cryptosporidium parvum]TRY52797.1 Uncharacterized protein CTYZ_00002409 [Cryptosporidium tyzzeri]WKS76464.1 apicomplexan small protein [Cryptosporidium sp. 43IA8]|eukprot:QOY43064.1 hypothetical protein CPATCC_000771 [Cryptosporidium parvum]